MHASFFLQKCTQIGSHVQMGIQHSRRFLCILTTRLQYGVRKDRHADCRTLRRRMTGSLVLYMYCRTSCHLWGQQCRNASQGYDAEHARGAAGGPRAVAPTSVQAESRADWWNPQQGWQPVPASHTAQDEELARRLQRVPPLTHPTPWPPPTSLRTGRWPSGSSRDPPPPLPFFPWPPPPTPVFSR